MGRMPGEVRFRAGGLPDRQSAVFSSDQVGDIKLSFRSQPTGSDRHHRSDARVDPAERLGLGELAVPGAVAVDHRVRYAPAQHRVPAMWPTICVALRLPRRVFRVLLISCANFSVHGSCHQAVIGVPPVQ